MLKSVEDIFYLVEMTRKAFDVCSPWMAAVAEFRLRGRALIYTPHGGASTQAIRGTIAGLLFLRAAEPFPAEPRLVAP